MNRIQMKGEKGFVRITPEPETASTESVRCAVEIQSRSYRAAGHAWFSTQALSQFIASLRHSYNTLEGAANLKSSEGLLLLSVAFAPRSGSVVISGAYREIPAESNELRFQIEADQSFISETLLEFPPDAASPVPR